MSENPSPELFLGFRAEEKALEHAEKHVELVYSILKKLQTAIKLAQEGKRSQLQQVTKEISKCEMEADTLRRTILRDISKSTLEATDRESLVRLAKALDRVADWAHDSSRILALIPINEYDTDFHQLLNSFAKQLVKCGEGLRNTIKNMAKDLDEAVQAANTVEAAEEDVDELYLKGLSLLLEIGKTHSAAVVVILRDLLHNLENTADAAEDAVDQLRIIILRHS